MIVLTSFTTNVFSPKELDVPSENSFLQQRFLITVYWDSVPDVCAVILVP